MSYTRGRNLENKFPHSSHAKHPSASAPAHHQNLKSTPTRHPISSSARSYSNGHPSGENHNPSSNPLPIDTSSKKRVGNQSRGHSPPEKRTRHRDNGPSEAPEEGEIPNEQHTVAPIANSNEFESRNSKATGSGKKGPDKQGPVEETPPTFIPSPMSMHGEVTRPESGRSTPVQFAPPAPPMVSAVPSKGVSIIPGSRTVSGATQVKYASNKTPFQLATLRRLQEKKRGHVSGNTQPNTVSTESVTSKQDELSYQKQSAELAAMRIEIDLLKKDRKLLSEEVNALKGEIPLREEYTRSLERQVEKSILEQVQRLMESRQHTGMDQLNKRIDRIQEQTKRDQELVTQRTTTMSDAITKQLTERVTKAEEATKLQIQSLEKQSNQETERRQTAISTLRTDLSSQITKQSAIQTEVDTITKRANDASNKIQGLDDKVEMVSKSSLDQIESLAQQIEEYRNSTEINLETHRLDTRKACADIEQKLSSSKEVRFSKFELRLSSLEEQYNMTHDTQLRTKEDLLALRLDTNENAANTTQLNSDLQKVEIKQLEDGVKIDETKALLLNDVRDALKRLDEFRTADAGEKIGQESAEIIKHTVDRVATLEMEVDMMRHRNSEATAETVKHVDTGLSKMGEQVVSLQEVTSQCYQLGQRNHNSLTVAQESIEAQNIALHVLNSRYDNLSSEKLVREMVHWFRSSEIDTLLSQKMQAVDHSIEQLRQELVSAKERIFGLTKEMAEAKRQRPNDVPQFHGSPHMSQHVPTRIPPNQAILIPQLAEEMTDIRRRLHTCESFPDEQRGRLDAIQMNISRLENILEVLQQSMGAFAKHVDLEDVRRQLGSRLDDERNDRILAIAEEAGSNRRTHDKMKDALDKMILELKYLPNAVRDISNLQFYVNKMNENSSRPIGTLKFENHLRE
ncbi:hypothetical protein BU24DRAFT_422843 [Aaosphaeria arxii CBS 175.79]|uniref:Uncharacterized protein n=1 Tax=Aaosphaeria arxii CBS 175.79 TaxID=1450172 RepID=A0A6A5XUW7_9PLEO|nr:uncharacterized protein BU24DRAFT_422843 [Aaosphaeria arxii CBS 175.79]KAF2016501.1 hypothetical protein BU24DRAFT_422843 [Aaosphaeria arxii CBS 175.79]